MQTVRSTPMQTVRSLPAYSAHNSVTSLSAPPPYPPPLTLSFSRTASVVDAPPAYNVLGMFRTNTVTSRPSGGWSIFRNPTVGPHTPPQPDKPTTLRRILQFCAPILWLLLGAACITAAVYASIDATQGLTQIQSADAATSATSYTLRNQCREAPWYPTLCSGASDNVYRTEDTVVVPSETDATTRNVLEWTVDKCGVWTKLTSVVKHDEQECVTTCAQDGSECSVSCSTVTVRDSTEDLTPVFAGCPNYVAYETFVNSTVVQGCEAVMGATEKSVVGDVTGAVFASVAGVLFLGHAVLGCRRVWVGRTSSWR
ncbi:hypothetical protein HK104_003805 [Borealophlyctis nickersoniae]|nr:hypothetical protein HK104_003805 [Borealophlyctis nickersoniae]